MGDKFAWIKKKELGLPLGVWALLAAVVILYVYRKRKANTASSAASGSSSLNPSAVDSAATPSSGGASDTSGSLAAIANDLAMQEQVLSSVLDKLQGGKLRRPHRRKHHPKASRAPHTRKTPITLHRHRDKVKKARRPHRRSSVSIPHSATFPEAGQRPVTPTSYTAKSMGVTSGGLRKPAMGSIPKLASEPLAHPRGELDPNVERIPVVPDVSYTRGVSTTAKRTPEALPSAHSHNDIHRHHPAFTKPRKH